MTLIEKFPDMEKLVGIALILIMFMMFSGLTAIFTLLWFAFNSTYTFLKTFSSHIGFQQATIYSNPHITNKIMQKFYSFEKKHISSKSRSGYWYDAILGKGLLRGKFNPHTIFFAENSDCKVYFCGLTSVAGIIRKHKSCCYIFDENFKFQDFTLKSKGPSTRLSSIFSGCINSFELEGKHKETSSDFFKSFKLDKEMLYHTGSITITGKRGTKGRVSSLFISCDARLRIENLGKLYGIWNDIYRIFLDIPAHENKHEEL